MSGVDTFTTALRWVALGLSVAFVLSLAEIVRHWLWQRRQAAKSTKPQGCHCKVVESPHDWAAHEDWVKP